MLLEQANAPAYQLTHANLTDVVLSCFLKERSPITVTGRAAGGNLPALMNLLGTTENILAIALSSVKDATEHFPGQTTLPYI